MRSGQKFNSFQPGRASTDKPRQANCLIRGIFTLLIAGLLTKCAASGEMNNDETAMFRLSFDPATSEKAVVDLIKDARKTIDVSLYGFENDNIANALVEAHQRRGIKVQMSTEFDSESLRSYQQVILAGIPVKLGNTGGIQHNKYFIVDKKYLVTGSTNLTGGMLLHYNNMVILKSEELAAEFQKDFNVQWAGYYSGSSSGSSATGKDRGYSAKYGIGQTTVPFERWLEKSYEVGPYNIQAFFTPYQNTFNAYSTRYPGDPDCSTVPVDTTSSTTIESACASLGGTFAAVNYCYNNSDAQPSNWHTVYRHFNADTGAYQCKGNSASYSDYRSALNVVIQLLRSAKKSVTCFFFAFTDRVLMNELKNAKARGVNVRVYLDYNQYRSQYRNSGASFIDLRNKVGFVKLVRKWNSGLNHHKVVYVDGETLILGSMNYSAAAVTSNDENFLLIKNAGSLINDFNREAARIDEQSFYLPPVEDDGSYISDPGD